MSPLYAKDGNLISVNKNALFIYDNKEYFGLIKKINYDKCIVKIESNSVLYSVNVDDIILIRKST